MNDGFVFDNDGSRGIWKIVLGIFAIILVASGLLGLLIGTSIIGSGDTCRKVSENTGISIEKCDVDERFRQIIFVLGDTANTPKPVISKDSGEIISSMYDAENENSKGLSYISVSEPDDAPQSFDVNKHNINKIKEKVTEQVGISYATVDGADYLEAIRTAAYYAKDKTRTLIYVIGSGLSDRGLLNFADDRLLDKHSTEDIKNKIAGKVKDKNELAGLTIYWEGLGETVDPQKSLNVDFKDKLERIYSVVFREYGLRQDDFIRSKTTIKSETNNQTKNKVKVTVLDGIIIDYTGDESEFAFYPGTASFKDQSAANKKVLEMKNKYGGAIYYIAAFQSRGYCDKGVDEQLLKSRAEAVKRLLLDAGVSESDIRIEDGGIGDANECPKGSGHYPVNELEASKNRKVRFRVIPK